MVYRRLLYIKELPIKCTACPLYPIHCSLALENEHLKNGLDERRDESCSLVEIMESDIDFLLSHAIQNRESSKALSEIPQQKWKEAHKAEVVKMDGIIARLELIKKTFKLPFSDY